MRQHLSGRAGRLRHYLLSCRHHVRERQVHESLSHQSGLVRQRLLSARLRLSCHGNRRPRVRLPHRRNDLRQRLLPARLDMRQRRLLGQLPRWPARLRQRLLRSGNQLRERRLLESMSGESGDVRGHLLSADFCLPGDDRSLRLPGRQRALRQRLLPGGEHLRQRQMHQPVSGKPGHVRHRLLSPWAGLQFYRCRGSHLRVPERRCDLRRFLLPRWIDLRGQCLHETMPDRPGDVRRCLLPARSHVLSQQCLHLSHWPNQLRGHPLLPARICLSTHAWWRSSLRLSHQPGSMRKRVLSSGFGLHRRQMRDHLPDGTDRAARTFALT